MLTGPRFQQRCIDHDRWAASPLAAVVVQARIAIVCVLVFTSISSLVALAAPLFMMNLYERVLPSRNTDTLLALTAITLFLLAIEAAITRLRASMLMRLGVWCNAGLAPHVLDAIQVRSPHAAGGSETQALRDLDTVRGFWVNHGLATACAALWSPMFLVALAIIHPLLAGIAVAALLVLITLAAWVARAMKPHTELASEAAAQASRTARMVMRSQEAVQAMGMRGRVNHLWLDKQQQALVHQVEAHDKAAPVLLLSQMTDASTMILLPAAAAYLALQGSLSPAAIYAVMLIGRRAIDPTRRAILLWNDYLDARLAYRRLDALLRSAPPAVAASLTLPRPGGRLSCENVTLTAPGTRHVLLRHVDFALEPAETLGIVGPSGAGKSALARALVNVWHPMLGQIRLDGADYLHWRGDDLGAHIGYMPQDIGLLAGTVAENIRRFGQRNDAGVIAAAQMAGAHELILSLPGGYATPLNEGGANLSGGQRQRIALARAVYGRPALVVLDEPNAHLDVAGEAALVRALAALNAAGATVVLITHKAQLLSAVSTIAVLGNGTLLQFGPRDEVLQRLARPRMQAPARPVVSPVNQRIRAGVRS